MEIFHHIWEALNNREVQFFKWQSVGNDFVLIEETADLRGLSLEEFSLQVCDRRTGVGADGLLWVRRDGPTRITLRMFNPDGSEDFCGNGLRCSVAFAHQMKWISDVVDIQHRNRLVPAQVGVDGLISTEIGVATFEPEAIPMVEATSEVFEQSWTIDGKRYEASSLTTGSAHTILWVDQLPYDAEFMTVSPLIEHDPRFPERTSIMWTMQVEPGHLKLRIWERGAGETQGCGTGSLAAAVVAMRKDPTLNQVFVHNPGGTIEVAAKSWDAPLIARGLAHSVFNGRWRLR